MHSLLMHVAKIQRMASFIFECKPSTHVLFYYYTHTPYTHVNILENVQNTVHMLYKRTIQSVTRE